MQSVFARPPLLAAALVAAGWLATVGAQAPETPDYRRSAPRMRALAEAFRDRLSYVPGELIVKFRAGAGPTQMARALGVLRGGVAAADQRWIGDLLVLRAAGEPDPAQAAERLAAQAEVEYALPNHLMRFNSTPNDPSYGRQWHMDLIKMPQAWDINPGGDSEVTVAVIDSGVTTAGRTVNYQLWTGRGFSIVPVPYAVNPDLDPARFAPAQNFLPFYPNEPVLDMVGHGTHVAGTILQSTNNGLGLAGIAYRARLMPLKACIGYWDLQFEMSAAGEPGFLDPNEEGFCTTDAGVEAIRYAVDNGAKVINLSLGGYSPSPAYRDALRYAVERGVFVALSAGNDYEEGNLTSYPASYAAQIDGAMSVAAVGPTSRRAYYSQTGGWVEIAAPGGDVRAAGTNGAVFQAGLDEDEFDPFTVVTPRFDRYATVPMQGTSMASPHVAGVAALLYSQGLTNPAVIEAALKRFAVDLGAAGRDDEYGAGLIDARATLRGLGLAR